MLVLRFSVCARLGVLATLRRLMTELRRGDQCPELLGQKLLCSILRDMSVGLRGTSVVIQERVAFSSHRDMKLGQQTR